MQEGLKLCLTTINLYELGSTVSTVTAQWGLIMDGRWLYFFLPQPPIQWAT